MRFKYFDQRYQRIQLRIRKLLWSGFVFASIFANAQVERTQNFYRNVEYPQRLPKKKNVWVFIMAGQSNMAGRGFVEPQDTVSNARILAINKDNEIILAKEPLHFYE